MANKKADGVVEAAHLNKDGDLLWVRAYERRGPTWSDVVLLDRANLISRLEKGKRFFIGKRIEFQASEFEIGEPIRLQKKKEERFLVVGKSGKVEADSIAQFPRL